MSKVTKLCSWCKKPHVVRQADLNRGWGKFCSKKCKAMEQEKRTGQNASYTRDRNENDDSRIGGFMNSGYFGHGQE